MKTEIIIPRLSVNDDKVIVGSWLVNDGDKIAKDQSLLVVETTKETSEIYASCDGYIKILAKEGEEYSISEAIGYIYDSLNSLDKDKDEKNNKTEQIDNRKYTDKALALIKKHNIDVSLLPTDRIIKEKDIENLIKKPFQIEETNGNNIVIYGAGGFAIIVSHILKQTFAYNIKGVIDLKYPELKNVGDLDIIGNDEILSSLKQQGITNIVNALDLPMRRETYQKLKKYNFNFPNIIHKSVNVDAPVTMGEGNIVFANSLIGHNVKIGNNCVINVGSIINHDCIISDHCHIASGAVLAGSVTVGENTLIGQGVTIYMRVKIGKNVIIQNGCHVFSDVPDNTIIKAKK